jgi:hypothetical protein
MARRRGNKSQAVREYLSQHPDAMPKSVSSVLKTQKGLIVSPRVVSTIKFKMRREGVLSGSGRRKGAAASSAASSAAPTRSASSASNGARELSFTELVAVKDMADRVGGVETVKRALDALERLR